MPKLHLSLGGQHVFGAARGIGHAIAAGFAAEGCRVVGVDREVTEQMREPGSVEFVKGDVTVVDEIQRVAASNHRIRHVVYSVGVGSGVAGIPFWKSDEVGSRRTCFIKPRTVSSGRGAGRKPLESSQHGGPQIGKQEKRQKELARAKKRRKSRPQSAWLTSGAKSPRKLRKEMSGQHADVLQNIEWTFVSSHCEDGEVDDAVIYAALNCAIAEGEPPDELVADLVDQLAAVREFRQDQTTEVWRDCLRVVRDSVKLHSTRRPGETSYLNFVSQYVR